MPISPIGNVSGSTGTGSTADTLVLSIPGSYAADDFALVFATASSGVAANITANAEYTEKADGFPALGTGGVDTNIHCFYRKLTSGSDTDITLTKSISSRCSAIMMVFRGVDTTTPFDGVTPTIVIDVVNAGLNATAAAITPTTANGALVLVIQYASSSAQQYITGTGVPTTPAGMTIGAVYNPNDRIYQDFVSAYLLDYGAAALITPTQWNNEHGDGKINDGQAENLYDDGSREGTFVGGTGHAISDVITLTGGATVTVDNEVANSVTEFTVNVAADVGGHVKDDTLSQTGTTGSGTGFSLTLDWENIEGDGTEWATGSVILKPAAVTTGKPQNPLGHPFSGPFAGPIG